MIKRILFTGCGGGAVSGIIRCLKKSKEKFYIVGTEARPERIFFSLADKTYLIPSCTDSKYISVINKIIKKEKVDLVWVQSQAEVQVISEFRANLDTKIFLPNKEITELCYDKYKTNLLLAKNKIPVPKSIIINTKNDTKNAFKKLGNQIWLRLKEGVAGRGAFLASNYYQAEFWLYFNQGKGQFIASEYLPGKNYGCDMLFNDGELIFLQLKERIEYVLAKANIVGITGTTGVLKTIDDSLINKLCEDTVRSIDPKPNGVYAVDLKCDDKNNPHVTEINCGRFLSSSIMLFYKSGFNAPYITFKIAFGEKIPHIKTINPIERDLILARQLDDEPILYSVNDLKKNTKKKL